MSKRSMLLACALALSGCDWMKPREPAAAESSAKAEQAAARSLKQACGSQATYDRLKALLFEEAAKVRKDPSPMLDQLADAAVVRMESPIAKSRDEALNVTVCTGRFVLELPPGTEDAFDGDRRLEANVEYAAQAAADQSGLVYQMQGAEPIIYRLAALDLGRGTAAREAPAPSGEEPAFVEASGEEEEEEEASPAAEEIDRPRPAPAPAFERAERYEAGPSPAVVRDRPQSARPSFDCRYARSRVEKMICSDGTLAAQDRGMSAAFYAALSGADAGRRARLRSSRDRFLADRDRCPDADCVSQAYEDRVREIRDLARE